VQILKAHFGWNLSLNWTGLALEFHRVNFKILRELGLKF